VLLCSILLIAFRYSQIRELALSTTIQGDNTQNIVLIFMVGALTDVQIRGLEYVHIRQDNGADMLSQVLQSGMDKSFPGAARGVQRDQADCRAWMGLAGKKDAVLLLNSNMCSGICMLTYICARRLFC
jgi:hypothetical protein